LKITKEMDKMIVKLGSCVLTIKDVLPQSDAFEYYFFITLTKEYYFLKKE